jgi:hypothetical protein
LTKSRRYLVTLGSLRSERQAWQLLRHSAPDAIGTDVATVSEWQWVGIGWSTRGDAWLAQLGQQGNAQSRIEAREARCIDKACGVEDQFLIESSGDWDRGDRHVTA